MLTTSIILPHPVLRDFINNYSLCKSVSDDISITSPFFAHPDTSLSFFLGVTPEHKISPGTDITGSMHKISLFGLMTHCIGTISNNGNYNTFIIEFKPNGFNKMFGIPASEICNNTLPANEVIGNGIDHFYEQLLYASGVREMVSHADKFLIGFLNRQKAVYMNEGITRISQILLTNLNTIDISKYACQANMSIRNFERRFSEQVGTSPKLFCRLLRFDSAIKLKITCPEKSWTEIAYECGYYDGMHMIKEFKQFANASPARLFDDNTLDIKETFTTIEMTSL